MTAWIEKARAWLGLSWQVILLIGAIAAGITSLGAGIAWAGDLRWETQKAHTMDITALRVNLKGDIAETRLNHAEYVAMANANIEQQFHDLRIQMVSARIDELRLLVQYEEATRSEQALLEQYKAKYDRLLRERYQ